MNENPPEKTVLSLKDSPSRYQNNTQGLSRVFIACWDPGEKSKGCVSMQYLRDYNNFSCLCGVKYILEIQFKLNQLLNKK